MLRAAAPPTSSPFGGGDASSTPPAGVPRPCFSSAGQSSSASAVAVAALRRANSGLQRQYSSSLQSQKTLQMPRQRSSRCCAIAETLELVGSASAAVSSFDEVCEAFGDIAKLDNVIARGATSAAAVLSPPGAGVGFDMSVALSWGVEKVVGSLGSLALLEGLVDKTLIDLFQQVFSALELAGSTFDTPWLRLGVAVAIAVAVRQAVVGYKAAHPQKLQRQLSPAASLSDVLAEQAAAAVLSAAGLSPSSSSSSSSSKQQPKQQQQQKMERQRTLPLPSANATHNSSTSDSSSSNTSSSSVLSGIVSAAVKSPRSVVPRVVGPAAVAGSTMLLLGQVKRANKIKKQVAAVVSEVGRGQWSPAALMVVIEAAALVHSYSEMASGVATLLHLGA